MTLSRPLALIMALYSLPALSYDQFEAGRAAGMYLAANDILIHLKKSQCGYVGKKEPKSENDLKEEILSHLSVNDRPQFRAHFASAEFKTKMAENIRLVDESISRLFAETDQKTACGMVWGSLGTAIDRGSGAWESFLKKNGLNRRR